MKYRLITCMLMLISFSAGKPVGPSAARAAAECWLGGEIEQFRQMEQDIYLAVSHGKGFVLLADDDEKYPILGFSEVNAFRMNSALENMLNDYSTISSGSEEHKQIASRAWKKLLNNDSISRSFVDSTEPLIETAWDQTAPYNESFPHIPGSWAPGSGSGGKVFGGCVAVVMGQLLRYYEWPPRGVGSYGYEDFELGAQYRNFSEAFYDWEGMPESIDIVSDSADIANISGSLYDCAVSVGMQYMEDGSSATLEDAAYALVSHFDFNRDFNLNYRSDYNASQWSTLLKNEIDAGRPVPYRGRGSGGHAFLCDGYKIMDGGTYFHFNWGWGGYADGWFLLNDLTPVDDTDYSENQGFVSGLKPDDGSSYTLCFNDFELMPYRGWIMENAGYYSENGSSDLVYSGLYSAGFDSSGQRILTPRTAIPDDNQAHISFWAKSYNGSRICRLAVSNSDTAAGSFDSEMSLIQPPAGIWTYFDFNLRQYKSREVYFAFEYLSSTGYLFIDELAVSSRKFLTKTESMRPEAYDQIEVFPNPFNVLTMINFTLRQESEIEINIMNIRGETIEKIYSGYLEKGKYRIPVSAEKYSSGLYVIRMTADGQILDTEKITLLK